VPVLSSKHWFGVPGGAKIAALVASRLAYVDTFDVEDATAVAVRVVVGLVGSRIQRLGPGIADPGAAIATEQGFLVTKRSGFLISIRASI
jgi:hypothetical protein